MQRTTESDAMMRYAAGDEAAFAQLYHLVAPRLYGHLLRRTRDPARAEELLQQTFLHVHRARASFLPEGDVLPWVFAIATRLVIDSARVAAREASYTRRVEAFDAPDEAAPADDLVEAQQLARRIQTELERLPEPQRVAFELLKRRELPLTEVARALGISVGAVKLRVHRAHRTLRAALRRVGEVP